jgi:hypothetical protein
MKVRRTCRSCGYVWEQSGSGAFAAGCLGWVWQTIWVIITTLIFRRATYIDVAKASDEATIKTRCPKCGTQDNYKTEYVKDEKELPEAEPKPENKIEPKPKKDVSGSTLFYLSLFLGYLGVDRFYAGKIGTGILKLLTIGGIGIWWIIDLILILCDKFKDSSGKAIKMQGSKIIPACLISLPCLLCVAFWMGKSPEKKVIKQYATEQVAKDSLQNEESYAQAKQLFDEGKYSEALPDLKKVGSKHKEYGEAQNMLAFADEYAKASEAMLNLSYYIYNKNEFAASPEFQSALKNAAVAKDKTKVLAAIVVAFGVAANNIELCEKFQKSEMKYLKPQERDKLKAELKKLITPARNKLKNEQRRDFPILRKEYAKITSENLWSINYEVEARGNRNSRLEFTHIMFANNANIEDFQKKILIETGVINDIKLLRFKSIAYKWSKHNDKYTYYEYDTPADDVEVNENTMGEVKK